MAPKKRSASSVSVVRIIVMIVLMLIALIGLAFMMVPHKPAAPPSSIISYESRPEGRARRYDETPSSSGQQAEQSPEPSDAPQEAAVVAEGESMVSESAFKITIGGVVLVALDRKPIRNAEVKISKKFSPEDGMQLVSLDKLSQRAKRAELTSPKVARSDEKGAFSVQVAHPGVYEVTVTAQGYVRFTTETQFLSETLPEATIEALLSAGASLSGRVTESGSGKGATGVIVRTESADSAFASTDREGQYTISGLAPGEFGVLVDLRGSPYMAGRDLPYQRVSITTPDQKLTGVDFTVEAAGLVWGYVLSPNQEPIGQANVTLTSSESMIAQALKSASRQSTPLSDSSGSDGYYELSGVPLNQEWRIHALSGTYAPQLSDPFLITASQRDVRIDVIMFAGTNVYGQVVSGDGNPVPGAEVMCIPSYGRFFSAMTAPQAFRGGTSDKDGFFTLQELPAGDYQVFAQKKGFKVSPVGFPIYPDGYSDLRNVIITLRSVEEGTHAVFGVVQDDRGMPIDGADVRLAGVSMGGLEGTDRNTSTSNGGVFRFDGVSAGQYTVVVSQDGYSPTTVRRIRLNEEMRIVLRQSARVRGRVIIKATNQPPETYDVAAYPISERTGAVSTMGMMSDAAKNEQFYAPDGSFELILNAGAYRLEGSASGYTPARQEITIQAGEVLEGIEFTLDETGGIIAGTVIAGDKGTVQGAEVTLIEASSPAEALMMLAAGGVAENRVQRVGEDGSFRYESLPPGEYVVIAQHPTYPNAQSDLIALQEGGKEEGVMVRFSSGGALEGYVYREGQPVSGAVVLLVGNGITQNTNADETGYYYIDGLTSGVYQAMVTDISAGDITSVYEARGVQVSVQEGVVTRYDFGTNEGGRIEGRCMPGPINMLGGRAVLQHPGAMQAQLGETVEVTQLLGQSVGITPLGGFVMEDVPAGEWQLDIYYFELGVANPLEVRFVHTELIQVEQGQVLTLNLPINY